MLLRHSLPLALILGIATVGAIAQDVGDARSADVAPQATLNAEAEPATATAGHITGMIKVKGRVEEAKPVDLSQDAHCVELHAGGTMLNPIGVVKDSKGGLKDVFVQLTRVPDKKYDVPDEPVEIDQIGCTYVPHVWGVMKKQDIKIVNSDATLHNIHALPKSNKEFNYAMPNQGDERSQKFKKTEDAIHIKCDVHPWMATFCFVVEHPYFAVSGDDGSFSIDTAGLPDGEYGVKIWHEVLGEAEGTVKVADGNGTFEHTFETGKE